ncbi:hypothetical protein T08_12369 [Trichinella sp. T8]|nr:hypothetical protein T08_12369 [Trichinella sp. T8]
MAIFNQPLQTSYNQLRSIWFSKSRLLLPARGTKKNVAKLSYTF